MRERGCLAQIAARPANAIKPSYPDLWHLYQTVRLVKPRLVFEFGSGYSTTVLAEALDQNRRDHGVEGRLVSLETEPLWARVTSDSLPAHLKDICEVRPTTVSVQSFGNDRLFVHDGCPKETPDLVYLDGPALTKDILGAGDVLLFEKDLRPGFRMVVDGRKENVRAILRQSARQYRVTYRKVMIAYDLELIS